MKKLLALAIFLFGGCTSVPTNIQGQITDQATIPPIVIMIDGDFRFQIVSCQNFDCSLYCIEYLDGRVKCDGYIDPEDVP